LCEYAYDDNVQILKTVEVKLFRRNFEEGSRVTVDLHGLDL